MNAVGPVLVLLTGVVTLRLTLSGAYTSYVKNGMFWLLIVSGVLLLVAGALALWRLWTVHAEVSGAAHDDVGDHVHGHATPGPAYLLVLPLLVAYAVAPPSLGAFSAARASGSTLSDTGQAYAPLQAGPDGVADVEVGEAVRRALYDEAASLSGVPVRMTGFVAPADDPGEVLLTRFVIACCAADGTPAQVALTPTPGAGPLAPDTWIEVVATYEGGGSGEDGPPRFRASSLAQVPAPDDPYES